MSDADLGAIDWVDLTSGNRSLLPLNSVSPTTGVAPFYPMDIAFSADGIRAYVLGTQSQSSNRSASQLAQVDLTSGTATEISSHRVGVGPSLPARGESRLKLNAAGTQAFLLNRMSQNVSPLLQVDLATGNRKSRIINLRGEGVSLRGLISVQVNASRSHAYVLNGRSVYRIDLITGDRVLVSGEGRGAGPPLLNPSEIALNSNSTVGYVVDFGLNGIVRVDFNTGDRTLVSGETRGAGPGLVDSNSVVVNRAATFAYVTDSNSGLVVRVNLGTGATHVVASSNVGTGPVIRGPHALPLDANATQLYVEDSNLRALFRIDLITGQRVIVSY